jgi:uncharacterized membrane protein
MAERWFFALVLAAALGSGLVAGVFYAFSTFVMKALARLTPAQGIAAMQSINVAVLSPWFLGVFLGTAALSLAAITSAIFRWGSTSAAWLLAGGLLHFAGSFVVTIRGNVPMNEALAKVKAEDAAGAEYWKRYLTGWSRWNHVRMAASLAASLSFILTLAA